MNARRKALALSLFTVAYNVVEGGLSVFAGRAADSTALIGFGLDSFVESLSGCVMVWRFWRSGPVGEDERVEKIERRAARLVGYTFFLLATYVFATAATAFYRGEGPDESVLGIAIAVASLIVMPGLFVMKYRLGKAIGSPSLVADSKETLACTFLSVSLLVGLVTYQLWGLWWIDSAAAVVIGLLLVREGIETLHEANE